MGLVRHRLLKEVEDAPTLVVFKIGLDKALNDLVCRRCSSPRQSGLGTDDLQGPFQRLNKFYDSVIPREAGTEVLEQRGCVLGTPQDRQWVLRTDLMKIRSFASLEVHTACLANPFVFRLLFCCIF